MKKQLGLAFLTLATTVSVVAQQSYAFRKNDIRAAYFHLQGDHALGTPGSYVFSGGPHVWFNLDSNRGLKPAGWNFYNPLAQGSLTSERQVFFGSSAANCVGMSGVPVANTPLNKRTVGYWWLNVNELSDEDISQIDVGLLQISRPLVQVRPDDRERLRRFVDKGGLLWIDLTYGSFDQTNGGPITFRSQVAPANANPPLNWDVTSPLLRYPNTLTTSEIRTVADGPRFTIEPINRLGILPVDLSIEGANSVAPLLYNLGFDGEFGRLRNVTASDGSITVKYGRIGEGFLVISSRGLSEAINRVGSDTNRRFYAAEPAGNTGRVNAASQDGMAASKFVYNLIALAGEATHAGAGPRKNFGGFVDVGAPLLQGWSRQFNGASQQSGTGDQLFRPPVIHKGMAFIAEDDRVIALDADPKSDIDRDGNPDDGLPDLSTGEDYDELFRTAPAGSPISSAVCVEVANPATGVPGDQLLVTTTDGRLLVYGIYDATRRVNSSAAMAPAATLSQTLGGAATAPANVRNLFPKPPTVHEGIAYVADTVNNAGNTVGRLWQADLRTLQLVRSIDGGGNPFVYGGTAVGIQQFSGSPTVGYIPIQDNSGGLDKVVYLATEPQTLPSQQTTGLISLWAGARGEKPTSVAQSGSDVIIVTRAASNNGLPIYLRNTGTGDPLSVRVSLIRTDGTVYTAGELANVFNGSVAQTQGTLTLGLAPSAVWPPVDIDPENGVRVDYTIDWGRAFPTTTASIERGRLNFPSPAATQRRIVDGVTLSPSGTLYATVSSQNPSGTASPIQNTHLGSLFAIREEGRGLFRCAYRWDLNPQFTMTYAGGSTTVPPALPDNDPLQYLAFGSFNLNPILGGPFQSASFQGAPVVRNGEVYVTVSGRKNNAAAFSTAVLCFKDDASAREIRIGRNIDNGAVLVQPDLARSAQMQNPTTLSVLTTAYLKFEREPGEVGTTIRVENMMNTQRQQVLDSISTSQPVILRIAGQPDQVIDPNMQGDRWSPLKWYTILHGTQSLAPAWATGNTLFVTGSSVLPDVLDGKIPGLTPGFRNYGFIYGIRTDIDVNTARRTSQSFSTVPTGFEPVEVVADDQRPYLRQLISMDYPRATGSWTASQTSITDIYPSQSYVWPQTPRNAEERGKTTFDDFRIRVNQATLRGSNSATSFGVVGGEGVLLAWNADRIFGFRRINTWVADEGRIGLYDPSGNTLYDSVSGVGTGATAGNTGGAKLFRFGRPTRVYPINNSGDALVVDTEQNRVARYNPNGTVSRDLFAFTLDSTYIPAGFKTGDPLTFAQPRDATTYVSEVAAASNPFSGARPFESWTHYIIADQGNNRLVEVVDRYEIDGATGNLLGRISEGTLLWHSPAAVSGKGYAFNSLSRVQVDTNRFVVVAGIGGKAPTRRDTGEPNGGPNQVGDPDSSLNRTSDTGNGGVILFDPTLAGGYRVFDSFTTPAVDSSRIWDFSTGAWSVDPLASKPATVRPINNLQAVTASVVRATGGGAASLAVMITDSSGVYECSTSLVNPAGLTTRWMLPNYAFKSLRRFGASGGVPTPDNPFGFFPTYARRIDDDNVIVVNGYVGKTIRPVYTAYTGEVLQIDGRIDTSVGSLAPLTYDPQGFSPFVVNLGFNTRSIRFRLGPVEGSRGLVLPVFADRR
jgi:hypothetical protein